MSLIFWKLKFLPVQNNHITQKLCVCNPDNIAQFNKGLKWKQI